LKFNESYSIFQFKNKINFVKKFSIQKCRNSELKRLKEWHLINVFFFSEYFEWIKVLKNWSICLFSYCLSTFRLFFTNYVTIKLWTGLPGDYFLWIAVEKCGLSLFEDNEYNNTVSNKLFTQNVIHWNEPSISQS